MSNTVRSLFHPALKPTGYKSSHGENKDLPMPELLVGLELEIEEVLGWQDASFGGFNFKEDNSLRNNGFEAITKPVAIRHVPALLEAFYNKMGITERNYSERCSTHVHFNALDLTLEQVSTIGLVYQTVEKLLFEFVGHDRKNNIFCVPWFQSGINYSIVTKLTKSADSAYIALRHWQKYSSLNFIPLTTQGTLEFRHLHGTNDVKLITNWISLIAKIFEYATKVSLEDAQKQIVSMNTVSNYREWLVMVFGTYSELLSTYDGFEKDLSVGVIESKLMIDSGKQTRFDPFTTLRVEPHADDFEHFDPEPGEDLEEDNQIALARMDAVRARLRGAQQVNIQGAVAQGDIANRPWTFEWTDVGIAQPATGPTPFEQAVAQARAADRAVEQARVAPAQPIPRNIPHGPRTTRARW